MLFSCHAFARVWLFLTWFFLLYHDDVHIKSQQRALSFKWSLVGNLNTYESTNGFNTVLNIQERKNLLTGQNNITGFWKCLKWGQKPSQFSCLPDWSRGTSSPDLQVSALLCDLTAAAEFSLKEVNTAEGWRRCWGKSLPVGATKYYQFIILIKNNSGPLAALNVFDLTMH